jgi:monoamine oxidase
MSGLAAAHKLTQAGWNVTVLEARSRLGGRVHSHRMGPGNSLVCELGGEWIGDDHDRVRAMCRHFDIGLQRHRFHDVRILSDGRALGPKPLEEFFSPRGQRVWREFKTKFQKYTPREQAWMDRFDWWTWLRFIGMPEEDVRLRDLADSTDFGETIRDVGAYVGAATYLAEGVNATDEMDWKITGGNERLPRELARRVGAENIILNAPVQSVTQKRGRVTVRSNDRQWKCDAVVCTVPTRALQNITFDPPLPARQADAARRLQYARIVKTSVEYAERFWKDDAFALVSDTTTHFSFHSTQKQKGTHGILTSYAVGDKADVLAAQSPARRRDVVAREMGQIFPQAPGLARGVASMAWQRDRLTQGAYAIYKPGQWFSLRPLLARPHGKVLFAGEHLADWQGFIEGAVNTGEAAADSLLGK